MIGDGFKMKVGFTSKVNPTFILNNHLFYLLNL